MTRSRRKSKAAVKDAEDWSNALEAKMRAWKALDRALLSALEEVPGVELEAWLCDSYILRFPHTLSPAQRRLVHLVSGNLDLAHASFGSEGQRYCMVSRDADFLSNIDVDGSYNEAGDGPASKARAVPSHKWFDPSITTKPVVAPHFLRAGQNLHHQQQQQHLLQSMTAYFGIHAELCIRISRASKRRAFDGSSSSGHGQGSPSSPASPPSAGSPEAVPNTLRHTRPWSPTLVKVVDTVPLLLAMTASLSTCHEIAFDVEMHSYRSYHGMTCLLQLASTQGDIYLVDTLAVWDSVGPTLRPLFANPKIVKIGHSVSGGDIPALHRDFGIVIVNCFCTQVAAAAASLAPVGKDGLPSASTSVLGLAALLTALECPDCETFTSAKSDMKTCDWRRRPLTPDMVAYASKDVHYLVDCYFILAHMLVEQSSQVLVGAVDDGDEARGAALVMRAWAGVGAGGEEEDDEGSMLFVDTSLPPLGAGARRLDDEDDDEDVLWEGWGDVDSPTPCALPSPSSVCGTHQSMLGSSALGPMSPISAATEEKDCSEDMTAGEHDRLANARLYQTAIEGSILPSHDDLSSALSPVAPSALPLVPLSASQVVNDSAYDGLYRVLLDGAKSASQRLWVPKPYHADAWRKETGFSRVSRHPRPDSKAAEGGAEGTAGGGGWSEETVHVYRCLHRWRNEHALSTDESPHYVAAGSDLFLLAEHRPQTTAELVALFAAKRAALPSSLARDARVERAARRMEAAESQQGLPVDEPEGTDEEESDVEHVRAIKAAQRDWEIERRRREAVAAADAEAAALAAAAAAAASAAAAAVMAAATRPIEGPVGPAPSTPVRAPLSAHLLCEATPSPLASRSPLSPRGLQPELDALTALPPSFPPLGGPGPPPSPNTKLVWTAAFAGTVVGAWLTVGCQLAMEMIRER